MPKANVAVILRQMNSINILSKINLELDCPDERFERHELMKNQASIALRSGKRNYQSRTGFGNRHQILCKRVQKSLAEREERISI